MVRMKFVMGDMGGGGHGQQILCTGGIDLNVLEGCFVVCVN